jgi:hypothetical protein
LFYLGFRAEITLAPTPYHWDSSLKGSAAFLLTASNDIARDETSRNDNFNILRTPAPRGARRNPRDADAFSLFNENNVV